MDGNLGARLGKGMNTQEGGGGRHFCLPCQHNHILTMYKTPNFGITKIFLVKHIHGKTIIDIRVFRGDAQSWQVIL